MAAPAHATNQRHLWDSPLNGSASTYLTCRASLPGNDHQRKSVPVVGVQICTAVHLWANPVDGTLPGNVRSGFRHCYEMARVHCGDAGFARITSLPRNGPQRHRCHLAGKSTSEAIRPGLEGSGNAWTTSCHTWMRSPSCCKSVKSGRICASFFGNTGFSAGPISVFLVRFGAQLGTFKATDFLVFGDIQCVPICHFGTHQVCTNSVFWCTFTAYGDNTSAKLRWRFLTSGTYPTFRVSWFRNSHEKHRRKKPRSLPGLVG